MQKGDNSSCLSLSCCCSGRCFCHHQGVLVTRKGEAERVTDLSANPKSHIQKLQDMARTERAEGNVRGGQA